MRTAGLFLSVAAYLGTGAAAWNHISESALREGMDSQAYQLVAFVLPSQAESRSLEAEWVALQETEKEDPNIVSLDCALNASFCKELDVTSFPTIRLYHRDGRIDRYRGDRTAREIVMFLRRAIRPPTLDAPTQQLVDTFTHVDDVVFMIHPHPDDWQLEDRFAALANKYRYQYSFVFATPFSKTESAVVCYNNIDDVRHRAQDIESIHGLEDFVKLCSEPLVPELTRRNEAQYTSTGKSILHYFATTNKQKEEYRAMARPLAKKYAEFLHFTITDAKEYSEVLPAVGLEPGSNPGLALQNPNNGDVYPLRGNQKVTAKIIEDFLEEVTSGKLQPWNSKDKAEGEVGHGGGHDEL